ncbi:MAG: hypothetical protein LBQ36_09245 [Synergistaceae bacterium]|nr:hypothetical protein [Synergistaceae bacterium]
MHYKKRERKKRDESFARAGNRGTRLTFISLAMSAAFVAVTKAFNPGMDVKPALMVFGGMAAGCVILALAARRKPK